MSSKNDGFGKHLAGRRCEVLTENNMYLGNGFIQSADKDLVMITNDKKKAFPVKKKDVIKITSLSDKDGSQTFVAKVSSVKPGLLKLVNAKVLQAVNSRESYRVLADVDAVIRVDDKKCPVKVTDISVGGMKIESNLIMGLGENLPVELVLNNNRLLFVCEIVRADVGGSPPYEYGIKFAALMDSDLDKINLYILNKQIQARQKNF